MISQRSQIVTKIENKLVKIPWRSFLILNLGGGPGSVNYIKGIAKFKKAFLIVSNLHLLITLTNSIVYKAAIQAVVVAKAGTILPAFNFTPTQSIYFKL